MSRSRPISTASAASSRRCFHVETLRQENKIVAFEVKWKRRKEKGIKEKKRKEKRKKKKKAWTHVYKFCFRFASSVRSHLYLGGTAIIAANTEEGRNWRTPKKPKKRSGRFESLTVCWPITTFLFRQFVWSFDEPPLETVQFPTIFTILSLSLEEQTMQRFVPWKPRVEFRSNSSKYLSK